jgi:ariadne-1
LSSADLISAQAKIIEEVNNIFQIPFYSAKTLLQHFKWEKELLLEKYYDNPEATFLEAGVVNPFSRNNNIVQDDQSSSSLVEKTTNTFITQFESLECGICFSLVVRKSLYFLGCGHYFCVDCWNAYLEVKIVEEGVSQLIRCPQSSCSIIVDEKTVFKLLLSEEVKKKYEMFIANSYVSESRHLRWCPAQKCDNVIKVDLCFFK